MISLYAGRLLLVCDRTDRNWHVRVLLGPKSEHQIESDTGTVHLQTALQRAQLVYKAAVLAIRPPGSARMCWDCLQWDMQRMRCELALPESRKTGGRYAARCEMYDPARGDQ